MFYCRRTDVRFCYKLSKRNIHVQSEQKHIVKGFVLPQEMKGDDVTRLQNRFDGKLTVVPHHEGRSFVYTDDSKTARTLEIFARFACLSEVNHRNH